MNVGRRARQLWSRLGPVRRRMPLVLVLLCFLGSRIYCRLVLGARFDGSPLGHFLQLMDPELLRNDLWRTLLYLHHQAPFLNFLAGVALKVVPERVDMAIDLTFFAGALALAISLFSTLKHFGVRPWIAAIATSLYTMSPPVIFYELWLMYHHAVTVFITLSMAALLRFLRKETLASGLLFFFMLVMVVLTRATFGLVFMAAIVGILLVYRPVARRLILKAAAPAMLFVAVYTVRVQIETKHSLGHALVGPNLVQKTLGQISEGERQRLFAQRKITAMEKVEPFPNLVHNPQYKVASTPITGIPALDNLENKNGNLNPNALQYVYVGDVAMDDAKFLMKTYPKAYLRSVGVAIAWGYFKSPTNDICAPRSPAYKSLASFDKRVTKWFKPDKHDTLSVLRVLFPLALLYGIGKLVSTRSRLGSRRASTPAIAIMVVTILYAASSLLISYADFSRYRFEIDVLYVILLTLLADDLLSLVLRATRGSIKMVRRRWARRTASPLPVEEVAGSPVEVAEEPVAPAVDTGTSPNESVSAVS